MKTSKSVVVPYMDLVKQLHTLQLENEALKVAAIASDKGTPVNGSFIASKDGNYLTLTFLCNAPSKVAGRVKSAKQGTQALYTQPRGGVGSVLDIGSQKAMTAEYGKTDLRVICSIGIR